MNKSSLLYYTKIIAVLFVLLGFKSINSLAENKNIKPAAIFHSKVENNKLINDDEVVISGTVKDEHGKPLEKARIIFDSTEVALTDKEGKFSFKPAAITPERHNIYFSCDSFVTVVRTYYPVMLSASYDVVLRKQFGNGEQLSIPFHVAIKDSVHAIKSEPIATVNETTTHIINNDSIHTISKIPANTVNAVTPVILDLPSILFKANETELVGENKGFLDIISEKLKENLTVRIDIKAYTPENDPNSLIAQKRLANIVRYLVEKKGIAAGRLNKVTVPGGGDENVIDLMNSEQ
jgi:hypothetical protein